MAQYQHGFHHLGGLIRQYTPLVSHHPKECHGTEASRCHVQEMNWWNWPCLLAPHRCSHSRGSEWSPAVLVCGQGAPGEALGWPLTSSIIGLWLATNDLFIDGFPNPFRLACQAATGFALLNARGLAGKEANWWNRGPTGIAGLIWRTSTSSNHPPCACLFLIARALDATSSALVIRWWWRDASPNACENLGWLLLPTGWSLHNPLFPGGGEAGVGP